MLYKLVNTSRAQHTRATRWSNPQHAGLTQWIGGLRIIRGRPLLLDDRQVRSMLPEIMEGKRSGRLQLTTMQDVEVDLQELKPIDKPPVSPPLPQRLPDLIMYDDPPPRHSFEGLPGSIPLSQDTHLELPPAIGVDELAPPVTTSHDTDPEDLVDDQVADESTDVLQATVSSTPQPEGNTPKSKKQRKGRR